MPDPGYIISAHGGRWSNQQPNLVVPGNSQVVYYVQDGQLLPNNMGYAILAALANNNYPNYPVVQQVFGGGMTYDYACWYAPEFGNSCGIYQVGSTQQVASLQGYTENNPLSLSEIFQQYPNTTIYWDACREISTVAEGAVLRNSPGSYLTEPAPAEFKAGGSKAPTA